MTRIPRPLLACLVLVAAVVCGAGPTAQATDEPSSAFAQWLEEFKREAIGRGIREDTVTRAFDGVEVLPIIRERDGSQPEFVLTLDSYLATRLVPSFTKRARAALTAHRDLLGRISDRYGVPGRVVVAIWGIESNFGRFTGVRPTVATLATLAFDGRRGPFFRGQLLDALTIVDRGDVELARLRGSWAGAMGQPQFMPSSYLKYAQDFDEDGRRDIWTSQADVFASIANYLAQHGWTRDLRWGREVQLPASAGRLDGVDLRPTGCRAEREMSEPRSWNAWRGLGLTRVDGASLPHSDLTASLVRSGSRAFLVSANYESLLAYNCAHHYALAVALLAEQV